MWRARHPELGSRAAGRSACDYDFLIGLRKPILFIHGDRDEFGSIETLAPLIDRIAATAETELVIFENCGHFFDEHLNELRDTVRTWTEKRLSEV